MRSDDIGRRERTRPGFYFMFCVWQSSVRGCRFSVMFVYMVIKMFKCSPVPASFFPYISTALHWRKAAAPHGRLPHTKHKVKARPGPLSSSNVVTPHLTLPKLLRGTRDRWVAQVSFIIIHSTGLAPFPRLSAPPHSSHITFMIILCCDFGVFHGHFWVNNM